MASPLVSAVVNVYESERYVADALESVRAQTHGGVELIVVDDGSTDGTVEIVQRYEPDRLVRISPNSGLCSARNAGLALARGDFIAFLDADDIWLPDKTERQLAVLEDDPSADYALGWGEQFADAGRQEETEGLRVPPEPQRAEMIPAMLAPRTSFDRVGLWPDVAGADGLHWFLRARQLGLRSAMVPGVVYRRRVHGENMSLGPSASKTEWARLLKTHLDHKRGHRA